MTYLHTFHLGSTWLCTDSNGASTGTCDYEPFGEVQPNSTCSVPTKFRFAGMQFRVRAMLQTIAESKRGTGDSVRNAPGLSWAKKLPPALQSHKIR